MADFPSVESLGQLYEAQFHRFLRVAEAITGDVDQGRDSVQEGFALAIRHRASFRGEGSIEAWVWSCVTNAARSAAARRELLMADVEQSAPRESERDDTALREILAQLPERQRFVLFLRYYADLDYQSIGEALNIEPGTVGATLNRAHATIRRKLREVVR